MMWQVVVTKVLCVLVLLVSGCAILSLSKICSTESDKRKKEVMGLGLLMSLILFMIMFYKVVFI